MTLTQRQKILIGVLVLAGAGAAFTSFSGPSADDEFVPTVEVKPPMKNPNANRQADPGAQSPAPETAAANGSSNQAPIMPSAPLPTPPVAMPSPPEPASNSAANTAPQAPAPNEPASAHAPASAQAPAVPASGEGENQANKESSPVIEMVGQAPVDPKLASLDEESGSFLYLRYQGYLFRFALGAKFNGGTKAFAPFKGRSKLTKSYESAVSECANCYQISQKILAQLAKSQKGVQWVSDTAWYLTGAGTDTKCAGDQKPSSLVITDDHKQGCVYGTLSGVWVFNPRAADKVASGRGMAYITERAPASVEGPQAEQPQ